MDDRFLLDAEQFFNENAGAFPTFLAIKEVVDKMEPNCQWSLQKTQISVRCGYKFLWISNPTWFSKSKAPSGSLVLTLGLPTERRHPRVTVATEAYPNRWTHHFILKTEEEADTEVAGWIKQSLDFAKARYNIRNKP